MHNSLQFRIMSVKVLLHLHVFIKSSVYSDAQMRKVLGSEYKPASLEKLGLRALLKTPTVT